MNLEVDKLPRNPDECPWYEKFGVNTGKCAFANIQFGLSMYCALPLHLECLYLMEKRRKNK